MAVRIILIYSTRDASDSAQQQQRWPQYDYNGENLATTLAPSFLFRSSSFLQVTIKDNYNIYFYSCPLNGFEIRQDMTRDCGFSCHSASRKIPAALQWEKCCDPFKMDLHSCSDKDSQFEHGS